MQEMIHPHTGSVGTGVAPPLAAMPIWFVYRRHARSLTYVPRPTRFFTSRENRPREIADAHLAWESPPCNARWHLLLRNLWSINNVQAVFGTKHSREGTTTAEEGSPTLAAAPSFPTNASAGTQSPMSPVKKPKRKFKIARDA